MNIGDPVIVTRLPETTHSGLNPNIRIGDIGVVCRLTRDRYGVDWGRKIRDGHSCNGTCAYGNGYYIDMQCVELARESTEFSFDKHDFNILMQ